MGNQHPGGGGGGGGTGGGGGAASTVSAGAGGVGGSGGGEQRHSPPHHRGSGNVGVGATNTGGGGLVVTYHPGFTQPQQAPAYHHHHHSQQQQIPTAHPNQIQHSAHTADYNPSGGYQPGGGGGTTMLLDAGGGASSHQPYYMQRSSSDTSMTVMDNQILSSILTESAGGAGITQQQQQQGSGAGIPGPATIPASVLENWLDDDTVPTVFRWEHGGRQVYITGTFNGWSRQIPMHRSGNDFTYIHNLKRGKHAFKFIVDDEWRFAPDQPTVADIEGRINNFIDVTSFKPYTGDKDFEKEKAAAEYGVIVSTPSTEDAEISDVGSDPATTVAGAGATSLGGANKPDRDGEIFTTTMPDMDEYTKEPPPLPPHLRHIILNKPPQLSDTAALPVPQHVALNHLYCTAIKDNMMVLGITQRYKTKFVTTVYYSPCGK